MKSFHQIFNELKKDRGLSNKQIASFTGVKLKEVKQWEAGTSFPIETKVVDALEGLLGTETVSYTHLTLPTILLV